MATYEPVDGEKAPGSDSVLTEGTDRIFAARGMKLASADEERANHPLVEADHTDGQEDERPMQSAVRSPGVGRGSFHGVTRRTIRWHGGAHRRFVHARSTSTPNVIGRHKPPPKQQRGLDPRSTVPTDISGRQPIERRILEQSHDEDNGRRAERRKGEDSDRVT